MKRVFKWTVPVDDMDHPIGGGKIVVAGCPEGPGAVQVWTAEDTRRTSLKPRWVRVYGTGHAVPDGDLHLASARHEATGLVWHLYGSPD